MDSLDAFFVISPIVLIVVLLWIFTHKKRHVFPRSVLFIYCFLPFALGTGFLVLTYFDFFGGQIMPIFFKGRATVSKLQEPILFFVGVALNVLFALIFTAGGLLGMLRSVLDTKFRFKK